MKTCLVVTGKTVSNTIVVPVDAFETNDGVFWGENKLVNTSKQTYRLFEGVGIGWTFDGKDFNPPKENS